jgi:hypothetical protein
MLRFSRLLNELSSGYVICDLLVNPKSKPTRRNIMPYVLKTKINLNYKYISDYILTHVYIYIYICIYI